MPLPGLKIFDQNDRYTQQEKENRERFERDDHVGETNPKKIFSPDFSSAMAERHEQEDQGK